MRWVRRIAFAFATIVALLVTVWAAAALFFDLPVPALRTPGARSECQSGVCVAASVSARVVGRGAGRDGELAAGAFDRAEAAGQSRFSRHVSEWCK